MLLNPYRFVAAYEGLDISDYSGDAPIHAYSMRLINSGYSGELIRLRRSSDNVESDFGSGLSMGEFLDYSAIDTWLSGATAYIVTWYDQSGQGRDITQSTAGNQPVLSASASFGRALLSSSSGEWLSSAQIAGGIFSSGPAASIHIALETSTTGFSTFLSVSTSPSSPGATSYLRFNRYGTNCRFAWRVDTALSLTTDAAAGKEYIYGHHDGSNFQLDRNTTQLGSSSNTTTANSGGDTLNIGCDAGSNTWDGYIYEVVIFDSSQSTILSNKVRDLINPIYSLY
jgi:hypothetical protein